MSREPYVRLRDWRSSHNQKIIGCLPMYIPEEIIHAAGILPIVLMGEDIPTAANEFIQTNTCDVVRSTLDAAVLGKLDFLDGLVFSDICDPVQFLAGVWKIAHPTPYFHVLDIPHKLSPSSREYLLKVWQEFRTSLEELSGKRITDQELNKSIHLYNQNRSLLRQLYDLRRANPGLISASDMVNIISVGLFMPKEEHNALLSELLVKAEGKKTKGTGVGLMLGGYLCQKPPEEVLDLIEELGGVILDDEMYIGARYFAGEVMENNDPMVALVDYYINRIPCTTMHYPEHYLRTSATVRQDYPQFLIDTFKKSGADGLVILIVPFCDPYGFKYPTINAKLNEASVPFLMLETGLDKGALGTVRTRIQAFLEMLQNQK